MSFRKVWISGLNLPPKDMEDFQSKLRTQMAFKVVGGAYGVDFFPCDKKWNEKISRHAIMLSNEIPQDYDSLMYIYPSFPSVNEFLKISGVSHYSQISKYKAIYKEIYGSDILNIQKYNQKYSPDFILKVDLTKIDWIVKIIIDKLFKRRSLGFTTPLISKPEERKKGDSSPPIEIKQKKIKYLEPITEV